MVLALMMILLTGILTLANSEARGSHAARHAGHTLILAETCVNLVASQLRQATTGLGSAETWASQPGMIRRFANTSSGPSLAGAYKLYSSPRLTHGPDFDPADEVPPEHWNLHPAHFTDLNQPRLSDHHQAGHFQPRFPIVDPRARGTIAGFDYDPAVAGIIRDDTPDRLRLPMPVHWIYVLRDGTLGALDPQGRFQGQRPATRENPISGRIAFWTDDESSKVNLNTASEGVYWSHPYGFTITERSRSNANQDWVTGMPTAPFGYATSIPLSGEFQRLPGHPANTSLSAVFHPWLPVTDHPVGGETYAAFSSRFQTELASYYSLLPRIADGGSRGGTVWTGYGPHVQRLAQPADRLFASSSELLFAPARTPADSRLTAEGIERSQFFTTAHSRAPEVTMHNKPRFSIWPVMLDERFRNVLDGLLVRSATVGGRPYFWQRYSHWTSYANPGSAQILNQEWDQIARNRELYHMLLRQMRAPTPGLSSRSFADKYGPDHAQILTSIIDYVRASVSTVPSGLPPLYWYSAARGSWPGVNAAAPGEGSVVPLQITVDGIATRGYGRFITVTEGALVVHAARDPANPGALPAEGPARHVRAVFMLEPFSPSIGHPSWGPNVRYLVSGLDQFQINGESLRFRPFISALGEVPIGYYDGLAHNNVAFIGFYQLFRRYTSGPNSSANGPRTLGHDERHHYPLFGEATITLPEGVDTMEFTGGDLTIEIRSGHDAVPGTLLQTIRMNFPDATWPVPRVGGGTDAFATDGTLPQFTDFNQRMQGAGNMNAYKMRILQRGDVVKAVEARADLPLGGDLRLLCAMTEVPADMFTPHPNYFSSDYNTGRFAHSLRNDRHTYQGQIGWRNTNTGTEGPPMPQSYLIGSWWHGWDWMPSTWSTGGAILPGRVHFRDHTPAVARGLNGAFRADGRLGDWETGTGITPDGSYIRKPTEASVVRGKGDAGYYVHLQGSEGGDWGGGMDGHANFHPNRQMVSPVQFGAIPSGVFARRPFETLLFAPNPAGRTTPSLQPPAESDHRGFAWPRDHLLLDLFWMPVIQPWAVSEPLSTAGKINLNYEIMPHRYIKRRTAVHALMDKVRVTAIPSAALQGFQGSHSYKQSAPCNGEFRYDINLDPVNGTLRGFEHRFDNGHIFASATELCEIHLVPRRRTLPAENYSTWYPVPDPEYDNVVDWWSHFQLTGDNLREEPYNHLYPRVTTKSNTYRIHYRVESLTKARGTPADTWEDGADRVEAVRRGSVLLERFIDPDDPGLPDFATSEDASVDDHYRFRVIEHHRFD